MNLKKKKILAAKALCVGKNRICFNPEALEEIKEAITKQDIKTLHQEGIITIKPEKGRRKIEKRKRRRGAGKIKMKVKHRKQDYVKITRKLRRYLKQLRRENQIESDLYLELRKRIKMKIFKSESQFKEYIQNIKRESVKAEGIKRLKSVKNETKKTKTKELAK